MHIHLLPSARTRNQIVAYRPYVSARTIDSDPGFLSSDPDPHTSVAQPSGELHDVRGVWIGDTSAFPSSVGVNPMVTCMALASRTAQRIADER